MNNNRVTPLQLQMQEFFFMFLKSIKEIDNYIKSPKLTFPWFLVISHLAILGGIVFLIDIVLLERGADKYLFLFYAYILICVLFYGILTIFSIFNYFKEKRQLPKTIRITRQEIENEFESSVGRLNWEDITNIKIHSLPYYRIIELSNFENTKVNLYLSGGTKNCPEIDSDLIFTTFSKTYNAYIEPNTLCFKPNLYEKDLRKSKTTD